MSGEGIVIVGGGPAAQAAAAAYREAGAEAPPRILSEGLDLPCERPPLTVVAKEGRRAIEERARWR